MNEQVLSAEAEYFNTEKIRNAAPPTVVKIDGNGIAHVSYSFEGEGRGWLLGCPTGRASIVVHFKIQSRVPVRE